MFKTILGLRKFNYFYLKLSETPKGTNYFLLDDSWSRRSPPPGLQRGCNGTAFVMLMDADGVKYLLNVQCLFNRFLSLVGMTCFWNILYIRQ